MHVVSYRDCASTSTGSDLTSTSETDEMMAARTELRGAPRSTESRNADTPLHGSFSLSNPRLVREGNRSDRPNRVRWAGSEARHEIPPSTTLTEVEGPCGSLTRARQPGSASSQPSPAASEETSRSLGCRHPRDRCPGISCRSLFCEHSKNSTEPSSSFARNRLL